MTSYCQNNIASSVLSQHETNLLCDGYCKINGDCMIGIIALIKIIIKFIGQTIIKEELSISNAPYETKYQYTPLLINHNLNRLNTLFLSIKDKSCTKFGKLLFDVLPAKTQVINNWYYRSYFSEYKVKISDITAHTAVKFGFVIQGNTFIKYPSFHDDFEQNTNECGGIIKGLKDKFNRIWHPINGDIVYKNNSLHVFAVEIQKHGDKSNEYVVFKMSEINRKGAVSKWPNYCKLTSSSLIYEMVPHYIQTNGDYLVIKLGLSYKQLSCTIKDDKCNDINNLIDFIWHQTPCGVYRSYTRTSKHIAFEYNFGPIDQQRITDRQYPMNMNNIQ